MLVMFLPMPVADTKTIFCYVFGAPLMCWLFQLYAIRNFVKTKIMEKV